MIRRMNAMSPPAALSIAAVRSERGADGGATGEVPAARAREAAGPLLAGLRLFDRYQGKGVESGFKSLAIGLILQDKSRTLTERDVESVMERVIAALRDGHGGSIRS
jgi:hypothetical protein